MIDVAFVSCRAASGLDRESPLLAEALARRGLRAELWPWDDPARDWSAARLAVVRSTWNYHRVPDAFLAWLASVEGRTRVLNPPDLLRWNADKRYLGELAAGGVPVVPTEYVEPGQDRDLAALLARWDRLILKPAISAGAEQTIRIDREGLEAGRRHLAALADRTMMIQPLMAAIETTGERSQIYLGGALSHAVDKRPKRGDFRCQEEHGGRYAVVTPRDRDLAIARQIFARLEVTPLYARVDCVDDEAGQPLLMELELIEPDLYLRHAEAGVALLAEAICEQL